MILPMLDKREIILQILQDNLDPFLNNEITSADFKKFGKIQFSNELLMITEKGIQMSFLIFFKIDVGIMLGPVHL